MLFISLHKDRGAIKTARSNNYSELKNNPIETSEEKLYEAIIEKSIEGGRLTNQAPFGTKGGRGVADGVCIHTRYTCGVDTPPRA